MLEEMYEKAVDGDYEIVMCDVNIIYVDEGKNVVSYTYSDSEIDISEYLIKGK